MTAAILVVAAALAGLVLDIVTAGPMIGACRSDRQDSPATPVNAPLRHYVIVRSDLPPGVQLANTIHAAGESVHSRCPAGTYAVALHARDEAHLVALSLRLSVAGVPRVEVWEEDGPHAGHLMAVGVEPTRELAARRVLSDVPLAR